MQVGSIQVEVITSRAKLPVPNATVILIQKDMQEKDNILAIEVSDYSGNTREIKFPTPSVVNSISPNDKDGFTLVDVWVEHPDFITEKVEGVQIFPEIQSILPVELFPLSQGQSSLVEEIQVELPVQNL